MRIDIFRRLLFSVSLVTAVVALLLSARADADNVNRLSSTLDAKDAAGAWAELTLKESPPPTPLEWKTKQPTIEQFHKYFMPYLLALADRAKDFHNRFPMDRHAFEAKIQEYQYRSIVVDWGDTVQQPIVAALGNSLLPDASLSPEASKRAAPLVKELTNSATPPQERQADIQQLSQAHWLGQPINLQFTAVDGRPVDLSAMKGKVVLVDFWATWCPPCVGEVPTVKSVYDRLHPKGFDIIGISLDKEKDQLTQFTGSHEMPWPQFFDGLYWTNKYARQFSIMSIPAMWLVDKKGNVADVDAREDLAGKVEKMLSE